ncbi:protein GAMETE EXPRESSED 1 isoform X2 [Sorghum bicolor]|uniref:protein GAMETE EXPRESSED 1 isoform X2 n=1 Tax=Sorghum bicolor TaxID=4558 RepID=UPI000B4252A3|nr:protein GAMETE EXPRESSED 1 isoform X2 [Sorghum bicolor]|eukprot:XP_021320097.1 protein GAMETE EXPRESSED 1 isoform X2 [Sorghum bicolor]
MTMELDGAVADFAMDGGANNDPRGLRLPENARDKLAGPRNCWQDAYRKLFASCGEIMADKERQSRLAWHLTGCFQEDSGRPPFPPCAEGSKMVHCRKRLSESEGKVFLEFFLETNTLCHQLQAEAFKHNIFCCSGQAVHSAQCHSCRVSLHQGLLLLLLHCVPRLHAHQRKANVRHQGPTLLWSVHYASIGDWVDQNWRRRFRQAVPGHVQVVLAPNGVPRRCHCSDPALHIHLQENNVRSFAGI